MNLISERNDPARMARNVPANGVLSARLCEYSISKVCQDNGEDNKYKNGDH